ncbi:nuclear transport factor 2 family protein [Rhizohabitans arisaemae]|uniref:nuclear transport factor 2 family protein n=1 Tax=Rhizohabitans arisaemae TaxID=2720610 RepID=UPI0024B1E760|nr:nuclear transport factor 2 family protein [Rhizohabitans arisaemae]
MPIVSYPAWFEADFGAAGTEPTGSRGTEVWVRLDGAWKHVHLHCSVHTPGVNPGS